jgi:hypothetical protein
MYDQAGGFKLSEAASIEMLVKYTHELSGYELDLENDIYDDLMDIGIAATKTYLDYEDLKFKDKYIDVKYLVVQNSKFNDFRNIDWVGHVEFYTIGQLRQSMPHLDEEDFKQMAYGYISKLNNPGDFKKHNTITSAGSYGYDAFQVAVFEAEWLDQEKEEAIFYDNKNGKTSKIPVNDESLKGLNARKRYVKSNLQKLRQASWVIGTDYVFDWGTANMQDRPANNKVISNYHIRAISDSPLIAQMRPILDDLQISYLRWQDARANAVKDGYALNLSKLKAIGSGDESMNVWEVLKLWKERGLLLYQESVSGKYEGGRSLPIDRLPNTLLDEINEFIMAWDHALKRMEDLTGINALILGAAPDPDAPVATQKLSVASSANAIKPLGMAMNGVKRKSAESFMRRFVLSTKSRKDIVSSYEGVIGKKAIQKLILASKSMRDYGMSFTIRPTNSEKAEIMRSVEQSMQNRREGRPGIDLQTAMMIREMLYGGVNLKYLRFYIGYMERKIFDRDQEAKMAAINEQGKQNQRLEAQKIQGQNQSKQFQLQGDALLEDKRAKNGIVQSLVDKDGEVADGMAKRMGLKNASNINSSSPESAVRPSSPQSNTNPPLAPQST